MSHPNEPREVAVVVKGQVEFCALAPIDQQPTFLVVFKKDQDDLPDTRVIGPMEDYRDRVLVTAPTIEAAIGMVLMEAPHLSYSDILDHMEV